jgi:hypothetical protein
MQQTVMVFATSAARTSGISSPSEGMVTYLTDSNSLWYYNGAAWEELNTKPVDDADQIIAVSVFA